ncbi:MAG: bifunctional nuclease family protein [Desulfovibrionaceae bacterium]|nr:bifunctional nuclease family protein [Desulfovibrionaceae bacterium]
MSGRHIVMEMTGLALDPEEKTPVATLREAGGQRTLSLWIGPLEAMSLSLARGRQPQPLPLTHVLMLRLVNALRARLLAVELGPIREGVLCASLLMESEDGDFRMECRPADALTLALHASVPIHADAELLQQAEHIRSHVVPGQGASALVTTSGMPLRLDHAAAPQPSVTTAAGRDERDWEDMLRRMNPISSRRN